MKKLIKLVAVITALTYMFSLTASASVKDILSEELNTEIDYMDDVYKYDLELGIGKKEEVKEEVIAEMLKYEKADNIVSALGLITFGKDGKFNEDIILAPDDFNRIAIEITGDAETYTSPYPVTHKDAVKMIMKALGYDFMGNDEWLINQAYNNKIIKKFSYNPEKHISRGEMAQLLYNGLTSEIMEMVSAGVEATYKKTGKTLLYDKFNMVEIEGLVTGVNGQDVYSNRKVSLNVIEIDRAAYFKGDVDTSDLFGKRVYGLIDTVSYGENAVHFLKEDAESKNLTVNFNQIVSLGSRLTYTVDGTEKNVNIGSVSYVVINGKTATGISQLKDIYHGDGKIMLASSTKGGNYDIAIVSKYESFVVDRFGSIDKMLHFDNSMTYENQSYIQLEQKNGEYHNIIKNGIQVSADDIKAGDAVSIYKNGAYTHIEVSDKLVKGKITSVDESKVYINDVEYSVSPAYYTAIKNGAKLPELKPGLEASFLLTSMKSIVSVKNGETPFLYGVMKSYGEKKTGAQKKLEIRILNAESEWFNYDFADRVTIDGKKMDLTAAKEYLMPKKEQLKSTIIRYKLNKDDLITAIDTVIEADAEEDDYESLKFSGEWHSSSGINLDWRKGLNLRNSTFSVKKTAKIFFIPEDNEAEDEYVVMKQGDLVAETPADLYFYNADEYFRSDIVVFSGETGGGNFVNTEQFLITNVRRGTDKDGNEIYNIKGLLSVLTEATRGWNEKSYTTTYQLAKKYPNLKSGDLVQISLDTNGRVNAINRLVGTEGLDPNSNNVNNTIGYDEKTYGTVVSVEPETEMMLVERKNGDKTELVSFEVRVVAIYDSATKTGTNVTLGDINPGDKVYVRGGYRLVNAVVYR